MRKALVLLHGQPVAEFIEHHKTNYELIYLPGTQTLNISLTLPQTKSPFRFSEFPAFFEGLLPEGSQLTALLRQNKLDERDYFSQLLAVGQELVGAVTITEIK